MRKPYKLPGGTKNSPTIVPRSGLELTTPCASLYQHGHEVMVMEVMVMAMVNMEAPLVIDEVTYNIMYKLHILKLQTYLTSELHMKEVN